MTVFKKATKEQAKLRVALDGPAKSGKTYTALVLAKAVTERFGGRVALIDTERGSASKYADIFDFDVVEFSDFHPEQFIKAIKAAATGDGYSVLVIDSLSHEWMGERGILQLVDQAQAKMKSQFAAWRVPSGLHTKLVDAMLQADIHLIATMRSKMAYEQVQEQGKLVPKKIGLEPVQRPGMEYEFDVLISIDHEHQAVVSGSRCSAMDSLSANKPTGEFFQPLLDWVSEGAEPRPKKKAPLPKAKGKKEEAKAVDESIADKPEYPRSMAELYARAEAGGLTKDKTMDRIVKGTKLGSVKEAVDTGWTAPELWKKCFSDLS